MKEIKLTPEILWAVIRYLNPGHSDYPTTSTMLARVAQKLEEEKSKKYENKISQTKFKRISSRQPKSPKNNQLRKITGTRHRVRSKKQYRRTKTKI